MDPLEQIRTELVVIRQAPLTFFISFILVSAAIYVFFRHRYKEIIERKDSLIETLRGQLSEGHAVKAVREQNDNADFEISIGGLNSYSDDTGLSRLVLFVKITNDGAPSTAGDWKLTVISPSRTFDGVHLPIPRDLELKSINGRVTRIPAADDLSKKLGNQQLLHGGWMDGVLWFVVKKGTKKDIDQDGTLLNLTVRDQNGLKHTGSQTWGVLSAQHHSG
jgi:hypothetical protein